MFKIKVNDNYSFELKHEDINDEDVIKTAQNNYHIIQNHQSTEAEVLHSDFHKKSYNVKVNNTVYSVAIFDELDQQIEALGFEIGASKQVNEVKAPMPGLILEISVKIGDKVEEDDALLILEAMKMENILKSPRAGIIKSIKVKQGETVDKNMLLIEFE
ncbi:acetyl-CoA carboxylase biotin carboxyl carrier protein subunit [Winogradskyella ursingii]|uniref:acetyl-CoA carboxylase biotin carboxyl carrier protein subunit n=1 Tax=Winogradskyella ursingii TaxID=2686079 RepID=UPI0015C8002C|nr:acetyl-CoA carboxylase biotin carboxyl carrier protein subunit [Winogradskyella ursingii]